MVSGVVLATWKYFWEGWEMRLKAMVAVLAAVLSAPGMGQEYPVRTVRIVTSPAGGGNDFPARLLAHGITGALGQQVIVDNRPTVLIGDLVAKASPDGYTLLVSGSPHWIGPLIEPANYDPIGDFEPISVIDRAPVILVVHPSMPVKSVKQLIGLARQRPGELNYGSGAPGGSNHLGAILFNHMAGVDIVRIPYKGSGPAMAALISGEVQVMFPGAGAVTSHLKSGRLRALAVGSAGPSALAPGIPTLSSSGVPGYVSEAVHALFAPARTPSAIVARLNREVRRYLETPEARNTFLKGGIETAASTPEALTALMKSEMSTIGKVLTAAGVRAK
jgi:tripartite-type tricarboxylate transporter receptor subunit TctC